MPFVAVLERRTSAPFHGFDCSHCQRTTTVEVRRRMLCGLVPSTEWPTRECTGDDPGDPVCRCEYCLLRRGRMVPGCDLLPTVCPGYSHRLPQVQQAARAHFWATECGGRHRWKPTEFMLDLIELFQGARVHAEAYELRERHEEAKRKRHG